MLRSTLTVLIIGHCVAVKSMLKNRGEYTGQMTRNDTLIDQNASVNLIEVDKKFLYNRYFNTYLTTLTSKVFCFSELLQHTGYRSFEVEVYDDGLMVMLYRDVNQNSFIFTVIKLKLNA